MTTPFARPKRARVLLITILLLGGPLFAVLPSPARADSLSVVNRLPTPESRSAIASDGTYIYVLGGGFGGFGDSSTKVVRYHAATNTVLDRGNVLVRGTVLSAVWDGSNVYLFGGRSCSVTTGDCYWNGIIQRYNPSTNTAQDLGPLPNGRAPTAVWTGQYVYLFGGMGCGTVPCYTTTERRFDDVYRYHPASGALDLLSSKLPSARSGMSAFWDGQFVYVIGGYDAGGEVREILKFNPSTGQFTAMNARLETMHSRDGMAWNGRHAYLIGRGAIARFDPQADAIVTMSAVPPPTLYEAPAAWAGSSAYVFGGYACTPYCGAKSDEIRRYDITAGAPQGFVATAGPGAGEISLSWQAPPSNTHGSPITQYRVYRSANASGPYAAIADLGDVRSFKDASLGNGVTRYYKVAATSAEGEGAMAGPVNATTFTAPSAPRDPSATRGPGAGKITLSWLAPANSGGLSVTGYTVHRAPAPNGPYAVIANPGNVLGFTDAGLQHGTTYHYRISATNPAGTGPQSATASAATAAAPTAPQNFTATRGPGVGEISLSWSPPTNASGLAINKYRVYRANTCTESFAFLAEVIPPATTHRDGGLPPSTQRCYRVSAVTDAGEGAPSASANATTAGPPSAPRNLDAVRGPGLGEITVNWQVPSDNGGSPISGYRVYRSPQGNATWSLVASGVTGTSWVNRALPSGATYCYRATAESQAGEGPVSATDCARTFAKPGPVSAVTATRGPAVGEITIDWSTSLDDGGQPIQGYRIARANDENGPFTPVATTGSVATWKDAGLPASARRCYRVAAFNVVGEGPPSAPACATTFAGSTPPTNLTAEPRSLPDGVALAWAAPVATGGLPVLAYRLERSIGDNETFATLATTVALSHFDATCPLASACHYRVHATTVLGDSPPSNEACSAPATGIVIVTDPCPSPPGWAERVLHSSETPVSTPEVSEPLIVVDGRPNPTDPSRYDLTLTVAENKLPTIGVFGLGALLPPLHEELVTLPARDARLKAQVVYRFDPASSTCVLAVGATCAAELPVDLADSAWAAREGHRAVLVLRLELEADGETVASHVFTLPYAGQAGAMRK